MKKEKFYLALLLLTTILYSCSKDDLELNTSNVDIDPEVTTKSIIDKWRNLGYSYDITINYLSTEATSNPVLNLDALIIGLPNFAKTKR